MTNQIHFPGSRRRVLMAAGAMMSLCAVAGWSAVVSAEKTAPAPGSPLKIGIIGTGRIGSALARHWAKAGHVLMLSSRHPAELQALAAELGPNVHVGTPREAAAFGEVVFVAVPYAALPQVGADYAKELSGKIIIDASNPIEGRDGPMAIEARRKGAGVASAEYLHSGRLVRAFNCINFNAIAADSFRQPMRRGIPIGGDDAAALAVADRLVRDAGFDPVQVGSLARSRDFDLGEILANRDWSAADFGKHPAR